MTQANPTLTVLDISFWSLASISCWISIDAIKQALSNLFISTAVLYQGFHPGFLSTYYCSLTWMNSKMLFITLIASFISIMQHFWLFSKYSLLASLDQHILLRSPILPCPCDDYYYRIRIYNMPKYSKHKVWARANFQTHINVALKLNVFFSFFLSFQSPIPIHIDSNTKIFTSSITPDTLFNLVYF